MKARLKWFLWKKARWLMIKRSLLSNSTILDNREFLNVYFEILSSGRAMLTLRDMYNLYYHLIRTARLGGCVAELGVYRGGGAKLIGRFKGQRPLHLFDTFSGMPSTRSDLDNLHQQGDFSDTSVADVTKFLADVAEVHLHAGVFPDSLAGTQLHEAEFSFVHLDADIYDSTIAGLRFFYPRLAPQGVLISHDYSAQSCRGVRQAFDDYFDRDPERVLPLWDSQVLVIKPG
jgi:O-methyltransferase